MSVIASPGTQFPSQALAYSDVDPGTSTQPPEHCTNCHSSSPLPDSSCWRPDPHKAVTPIDVLRTSARNKVPDPPIKGFPPYSLQQPRSWPAHMVDASPQSPVQSQLGRHPTTSTTRRGYKVKRRLPYAKPSRAKMTKMKLNRCGTYAAEDTEGISHGMERRTT